MKKKILLTVLAFVLVLSFSVSALAASTNPVDVSRAKEIALEHAGVDASEAVFTKAKLDNNAYEIKFYCGRNKYEYVISYETGAVLDYEWDIKSGNQQASATVTPAPSSSPAAGSGQAADVAQNSIQPAASTEDSEGIDTLVPAALSAGEILDIALVRAGVVDFSEVSLEKFELDGEVYKIEFKTKEAEFEYEIFALTGELLNEENDVKDNKDEAKKNPVTNSEWITGLEAEEIALKDAGIARTGIKYIHSYYKYYRGVPYAYQVEFGVYGTEYCYVLDLYTGEIQNNYIFTK